MRDAGKVVVGALLLAREEARVGVTTDHLDRELEKYIIEHDGVPVFKGYRGFPRSICTSVNEEVVHGIPGSRRLEAGDILSIDVGVRRRKYVADAAVTLPIGKITREAERLLDVCRNALRIAVRTARPSARISDLSHAIQTYVEGKGYSVVRKYTGHGIGRKMHEEPQVPNFVDESTRAFDEILKPGMTVAIEPMINAGVYETDVLDNKWTVVTKDKKLSAHFEYTVAITDAEADVLTDWDSVL